MDRCSSDEQTLKSFYGFSMRPCAEETLECANLKHLVPSRLTKIHGWFCRNLPWCFPSNRNRWTLFTADPVKTERLSGAGVFPVHGIVGELLLLSDLGPILCVSSSHWGKIDTSMTRVAPPQAAIEQTNIHEHQKTVPSKLAPRNTP